MRYRELKDRLETAEKQTKENNGWAEFGRIIFFFFVAAVGVVILYGIGATYERIKETVETANRIEKELLDKHPRVEWRGKLPDYSDCYGSYNGNMICEARKDREGK